MLETLRIENYALIEAVELDFSPGLNILTGETGAGKSILVGALQLLLGGRASSEVVRQGAQRAHVEGVFHVSPSMDALRQLLLENEIELEEDRLLLARTVGADGRSKAYAGGRIVSLGLLSGIGDELVDLHGQHEHQSILRSEKQRDLLDAHGGARELAQEVSRQVRHMRDIAHRIAGLENADREQERRMEFLRYEIAEIDAAQLEPGQEEELKAQLSRANNAEKIFELANSIYARLTGAEGMSAVDQVHAALREVEQLAQLDPDLLPLFDDLAEAVSLLEGVSDTLRDRTELESFDPQELERLNQRQSLFTQLRRKYGANVEEILNYRNNAASELEAYASRDAELLRLRAEYDSVSTDAASTAARLSRERQKAAKALNAAVTRNLQDLAMKSAQFHAELSPVELSLFGADDVRFMLAANAGETAKPLKQVASGGEISRIMLALKAVFADADAVPTLIFDEIDAGIGGAVARNVGEKLRALAQSHQVLCITHLAQIAALADQHFKIAKHEVNGHTATSSVRIEGQDRVEELARLLDGSVSKESVRHAKALLKETG